MRKSTLGYIMLGGIALNSESMLLALLLKQYLMMGINLAALYICIHWFNLNFFQGADKNEENND